MLRFPNLYLAVAAIALGVALGAACLDLVVGYEIRRMESAGVYYPRFSLGDPGRDEPQEEIATDDNGKL